MSDPFRKMSSRRLPPFPGQIRSDRSGSTTPRQRSNLLISPIRMSTEDCGTVTADYIKSYLTCHRSALEEFIMESVSVEDLEDWLHAKKANNNAIVKIDGSQFAQAPVSQDRYTNCDMVTLQQTLFQNISDEYKWMSFMFEVTHVIGLGIKAQGCTLYGVRSGGNEIFIYTPTSESRFAVFVSGPVGYKTTISAHVGKTMQSVMVEDILGDDRFPKGIGIEGANVQSVICVPVAFPTGDLVCIMEFSRGLEDIPFTDREEQIACAMACWSGCALYQSSVNETMTKHTSLNDFLLKVSKTIFDDITAMDSLVQNIMTYTKELVQADRCALFMVDSKERELFAEVFDEGIVVDGKPCFTKKRTIRFPLDRGIAGAVAMTGHIINIKDAYYDPRFNREVDQITGYLTRSILCMPIISKGNVIGVVQMINKIGSDSFSNSDETSFQMFAVYCALALHYSKIYRDTQRRTAQYQVALEQVSFHLKCNEDDLHRFIAKPEPKEKDIPTQYTSFSLYVPKSHAQILHQLVVYTVHDLFGPKCFDLEKLCAFVLCLKKSYRPVPYHNFEHGFNVFHCMYCILKRLKENYRMLNDLRMKALLIATISHDVDHRGFNNAFLVKCGDPLARLYGSSTMESHHYEQTVYLLQQEGCGIFDDLPSEEYKTVLSYIHRDIMATDLASYFPCQKKVNKLILTNALDFTINDHLEEVIALMMTAADLSSSTKPWEIQQEIVYSIYEEFHNQGDMEKEKGLQPIPMMDREHTDNLPTDQVNFIKHVCLPCYTTLSEIFPETSGLAEGAKENLDLWERIVEGKSTRLWELEKSVTEQQDSYVE